MKFKIFVRNNKKEKHAASLFYNAPGRARIHNLLVRSQTLYPIELRVQINLPDYSGRYRQTERVGFEPDLHQKTLKISNLHMMPVGKVSDYRGIAPRPATLSGFVHNVNITHGLCSKCPLTSNVITVNRSCLSCRKQITQSAFAAFLFLFWNRQSWRLLSPGLFILLCAASLRHIQLSRIVRAGNSNRLAIRRPYCGSDFIYLILA